MNTLLKVAIVSSLVLVLVPYSLANEWVPSDIIRMLETEYSLPDSSKPMSISKNMRTDNLWTMTAAKQGAIPSVQHSTLNEWVPSDIIRMLETEYSLPDS